MVKRFFVVLPVLAALILCGCGGGGGDGNSGVVVAEGPAVEPAAQALDQSYYPAAIGDSWVHTVTGFFDTHHQKSEIVGTKTIGTVTALELRETEQDFDSRVAYIVKDSRAYALVSNGTNVAQSPFQSGDLMRFDGTFGGVLNERLDLDSGRDLDGDGLNERVDVRTYGVLEGYETVVTPAGTFPDTGRVRYESKIATRYSRGGTATVETYPVYREWRAPKVGLVRWERYSSLLDGGSQGVLSSAMVGGVAVGSVKH